MLAYVIAIPLIVHSLRTYQGSWLHGPCGCRAVRVPPGFFLVEPHCFFPRSKLHSCI